MNELTDAPVKQRGREKTARIPVKVDSNRVPLRKPDWIRVRVPVGGEVERLKQILRKQKLHTVCEEAACPNLGECFGHGTATFLVMGDICTRRCPFCDVAHGKPLPLDRDEPAHLAETVKAMGLRFVVITSVDRDDLRDGGADHIAACVRAARDAVPGIHVETLVPDFRGRGALAIKRLLADPPDVFNHNLETVPRLYRAARPGADYAGSLKLLEAFGNACPEVPTKSGLMVGLGETLEEVEEVLVDLRAHGVRMLTIGQYLQPRAGNLMVERYVTPEEFDHLATRACELGFEAVASGPLVRSSYHAEQQAAVMIDNA